MVAMYGRELKNPQKNIPRALVISVFICFFIYTLLQAAFIGGLPPSMVAKGWAHLNFTSPLAQLLILLDMHLLTMWVMLLYMDSAISPSGTGVIGLSSAERTASGMARDHQFPLFFDKVNAVYNVSRRSLVVTAVICSSTLFLFKNWHELMILVSVFQLISCAAIPIAFTKLRYSKPELERLYRVKWGHFLSYFIFLVISLFLTRIDAFSLMVAYALYVLFFSVYVVSYYECTMRRIMNAFCSAWSVFLYMGFVTLFGYFNQVGLLKNASMVCVFMLIISVNYQWMIHQKNYNPS